MARVGSQRWRRVTQEEQNGTQDENPHGWLRELKGVFHFWPIAGQFSRVPVAVGG
jgi:hypothetical protein